MTAIAGTPVTLPQVRATLKLLRYYRRFLESNSLRCHHPERGGWLGESMSKDEARTRLAFLVNVAINRKAGIPDVVGRKQESDYQVQQYRDCRKVREKISRRVRINGGFETPEIRRRYRHLLTKWEDE